MAEAIGGHEGLMVYRTSNGIRKQSTTDAAWKELCVESAMLMTMDGSHAPRLLGAHPEERWTLQEDLGDSLSINPSPALAQGRSGFFEACVDLLAALRAHNVYHGDLTPPNLAWSDERGLCALDWQQSSLLGSGAPRKRPTSDAWQLLDTFMGLCYGWNPIDQEGGCGYGT